MALRTLDHGFDITMRSKHYATPERAEDHVAESIEGMVNVRVVPVEFDGANGRVNRYTPVFYCFSEESMVSFVASAGFHCFR